MKKKEELIGKVLVFMLVIFVILAFSGFFIFGFIGVVNVGIYLDLVEINLYPNTFSNILYFGSLFIFIYILLIFVEVITRFFLKFLNALPSLKRNILSYAIQILIGTILIKAIIDNTFDRIEVSMLNIFIALFVLYIIIFFSSEGHKGIDDLEEK